MKRSVTYVMGLLLLTLAGCALEAPSDPATVGLRVSGTAPAAVETRDGGMLTLTRADVAFGSLWLCAGVQSGELCETARAEWLGSVVVDALDEDDNRAGELFGAEGSVRSFMFDFGYESSLSSNDSLVSEAAAEIGGSVVLEGVFARDGGEANVSLTLDILAAQGAEQGVPIVRSRAGDLDTHDLRDGDQLTVRFDPNAWTSKMHVASLGDCEAGDAFTCEGSQATRCEDGEVSDCGGALCSATGCVSSIELDVDEQAGRAVRDALLLETRPEFSFD